MPADRGLIAVQKSRTRSRISNGTSILDGVDGRLPIARRYKDLISQILVDTGPISETKMALVRRYSAQCIFAEMLEARLVGGDDVDDLIEHHSQVSSTLVKLSARIGLSRHQRQVPNVREYLEARDAERKAAAADLEQQTNEIEQ